jgi:uncharacterized protein
MIRGLLLVVQALLWLLLVRFVLRAFASAFGTPRTAVPGPRERPQVRAPEDLVLDRVCHTYVPRSHAITGRVSGREEWFCSAACRDKALASVTRAS